MGVQEDNEIDPVVFFPIEITTREYPGYLLLAVELASRNIVSVIGHKAPVAEAIRRFGLSGGRGVLYYKGSNLKYSFPGFIAVGQDPEAGIVYEQFSDFFEQRESIKAIDTSSAYFCFGPDDYDYLCAWYGTTTNHIYPTGSPRVELWGDAGAHFYKRQVEMIRREYGEFVLIASSGGRDSPAILKRLKKSVNSSDEISLRDKLAQSERRASVLVSAAKQAIRSTGLSIVVRPHPAESWKRWQQDAASIPGLHVESALDLSAWIRASVAVIQNSSTAAFEAWLAGTPVIAFGNHEDEIYRGSASGRTPNQISLPAIGSDGLLETLDSLETLWVSHRSQPEPKEILARKLYPPGSGSVPAIAETIKQLVGDPSNVPKRAPYLSFLRSYGSSLKHWQIGSERLGRHLAPPTKRWPLGLRRIQNDVEAAQEILGRKGVTARRLAPNLFCVGQG